MSPLMAAAEEGSQHGGGLPSPPPLRRDSAAAIVANINTRGERTETARTPDLGVAALQAATQRPAGRCVDHRYSHQRWRT